MFGYLIRRHRVREARRRKYEEQLKQLHPQQELQPPPPLPRHLSSSFQFRPLHAGGATIYGHSQKYLSKQGFQERGDFARIRDLT